MSEVDWVHIEHILLGIGVFVGAVTILYGLYRIAMVGS